MSDGKLLLTLVAVAAVLLILAPFIVGALKESGHIRRPRRKPSAFRQFPLHPDGEE